MSWFVPICSSVLGLQAAAAPAAPLPTGPAIAPPAHRIVIDSDLEDWNGIPAAITDPADAPGKFVDFGEVRIDHDARFVYLLIDFGRAVNAQGLEGVGMILLDADGDPATGQSVNGLPGVDLIIDLSPAAAKSYDKTGLGIGVRIPAPSTGGGQPPTTTQPAASQPALNIYDFGLIFAPTYASRRLEFRIDRGAAAPGMAPLFLGSTFSGKLVYTGADGVVADETEPFRHKLTPVAVAAAADDSIDPLSRPAGTDLRVLSWNAEVGAIFTRPEPFMRTLAAIKPDLILLQELTNKNSADQLHAFLMKALPPGDGADWHITFGEGGGDLRCGIASKAPMHEVAALKAITLPSNPKRTVRAVGTLIDANGHQLLATSVHLKCCGHADGPEDDQRENEVTGIHDSIKSAEIRGIDGIIIAGDFNLVGARTPLEMMLSGLDFDGSALGLTAPLQLDGLSNATWFDRHQPFVPGRLDYMLFSDSSLRPLRSFVYDSQDLSPTWLAHYGVQAKDNENASDHLPVVTDFQWLPHPVDPANTSENTPAPASR